MRTARSQVSWDANKGLILFAALLTRAANFSLISIIARYLSDRGLTATTIGIALAVSGLVTAASQGGWARILRRNGAAVTAMAAALLSTLGCVVLALFAQAAAVVLADAVIGAGFSGMATAARTIAGSGVSGQAETESRFGKLSSAQTIGGFAGPLVLGSLAFASSAIAPWFAAALCLCTVLVWMAVAVRPGKDPAAGSDSGDPAPGRSSGSVLWRLRFVLVCTAGTSALYGGNAVLWGLYLKQLGGSPAITSWSFATFSLPMVFLAPMAGKIWRATPRGRAVAIGATALGLMAVVYGFTTSVPAAVGLTLLEGSLMALTMPIMAAQVAVVLPEAEVGRGYAVWGAVDTAAGVIGTAAGGILVSVSDIEDTWFALGLWCVACVVVAVVLAKARSGRRGASLRRAGASQRVRDS